jgi:DNA ligase-1
VTIRAMLAAKYDAAKIQGHLDKVGFLWMQPKIDGMRVLVGPTRVPLSRSGKEWKQRHLRKWIQEHPSLYGFDGEVVAGHVYDPTSFRVSMSGIRAEDGASDFTFFAFDNFGDDVHPLDYNVRREWLIDTISHLGYEQRGDEYHAKIVLVPQIRVHSLSDIDAEEIKLLEAGWEGGILRRNDRPYKFNRATALDGTLTKLKRFEDAEAVITGYEPWYANGNEAFYDELGYSAHSQHQENMQPLERLGAFHVTLKTDSSIKFKVGVFRGVSHADRDAWWPIRDSFIGRVFTFKHQGYGGGYDKPRTPVFLNWRSDVDF